TLDAAKPRPLREPLPAPECCPGTLVSTTEASHGSGHYALPAHRPLHVHGHGRRSQRIHPRIRVFRAQVLPVLCVRTFLVQRGFEIPCAGGRPTARRSSGGLTSSRQIAEISGFGGRFADGGERGTQLAACT